MGLVRQLGGFATLSCGCVVGRYRDLETGEEIYYIEERGADCTHEKHVENWKVEERDLSPKQVP